MIVHCLLRFVSFVAIFKNACQLDAGLTTLPFMVFLALYRCEELDNTMLTPKPVLLIAFINPLLVLWVFMFSDDMRNYRVLLVIAIVAIFHRAIMYKDLQVGGPEVLPAGSRVIADFITVIALPIVIGFFCFAVYSFPITSVDIQSVSLYIWRRLKTSLANKSIVFATSSVV